MHSSTRRLLCLSTLLGLAGCGSTSAPADGGPNADATVETDAPEAIADAPSPASDGGSDAGPPRDIHYLIPGRPIDLTPDGTLAVVEDPGTSEVFFYDVATDTLTLETTVGNPARDFSTAVSATRRLSAHHDVPVQAGVWDGAAWTDLPSPFAAGCGEEDVAAAWDLSADGTTIVGMAWEGCSPAAMRWTLGTDGMITSTTLERLGSSPGSLGPVNRATVISDDGRVAAGFAQTEMVDRWPAVWRSNGSGLLLPGSPPDAPGEVLAISSDGSVVAGTQNLEAFIWTEAGGMVVIGRLPDAFGADTAYPNAIAAGGALIFGACGGFGSTQAFVWTEAAGMRPLAPLLAANGIELPIDYTLQNIVAASADGTVLLGTSATGIGTPGSVVIRLPVSAYGL